MRQQAQAFWKVHGSRYACGILRTWGGHGGSFEETRAWYDGYRFLVHRTERDEEHSIYNPKSVVEAMLRHQFGPYWNQTETYEVLKAYIQMDMDGLKSAVVEMLGGKAVRINVGTFSNDMTTLATRDDVLTLLVHLGYLTYNSMDETVSIPNREVSREYLNAISTMDWTEVIRSTEDSHRLLEAMWNLDGNTPRKHAPNKFLAKIPHTVL